MNLPGASHSHAEWGDYDNDLDLDLLVTSSQRKVQIYRNDGQNLFTDIGANIGTAQETSALWGDFDNDGDLDFYTIYYPRIYENIGNGNFNERNSGIIGVDVGASDYGDLDNDGDLDVIITGKDYWTGNLISKLYLNNGAFSFSELSTNLIGVKNSSVALADYDNDGDLDVFISGIDSISTKISRLYKNYGNNNFVEIATGIIGVENGAVSWGDYDSDGDYDLLLSGINSNNNKITKVYKNYGNDNFNELNLNLPGLYDGSICWGDYDNDGDLDILLSGLSDDGEITKIFYNAGNDIFNELHSILPGTIWGTTKWGDYDNDNDLDFVLTGSNQIKIYKNKRNNYNTLPSPPSNPQSSVSFDNVQLFWNLGSDNETPVLGLNYNLRIGKFANGNEVLTSHSDSLSGFRKMVDIGNSQKKTDWTIKNLLDGIYYWSVQTIDGAYSGSQFVPEQTFTISNTNLNLATPNGNEILYVRSMKDIIWYSTNISSIKIDYSIDNGMNWINIADSVVASQSTYMWTIPNTPSDSCKLKITDINNPGKFDISDDIFSIAYAESINVVSPNGGENWPVGSIQIINWNSENVSNVNIIYSTTNGSNWDTIATNFVSPGNFLWLIPNTISDQCLLKIYDVNYDYIFDLCDSTFSITPYTGIYADDNGLPKQFVLFQNYPNPFNPSTTIRYGLPKAENVLIEIFSITGQKIETLINQEKQAGYHQVSYDARNYAIGIYFYRIQAGKFSKIKKMILVK